MNYNTATGLYGITEPVIQVDVGDYFATASNNIVKQIKATSNSLINYNDNTSNRLAEHINLTSNYLAEHINATSNYLAEHINHTSNSLAEHINTTSNYLAYHTNITSNSLADHINVTSNYLSTHINTQIGVINTTIGDTSLLEDIENTGENIVSIIQNLDVLLGGDVEAFGAILQGAQNIYDIINHHNTSTNHVLQRDNPYAEQTIILCPLPVPRIALDNFDLLLWGHTMTIRNQFEPNNSNVKYITEKLQDILQEHELRLTVLEFFGTITDIKRGAKLLWMAGRWAVNRFGRRIIERLFPSLLDIVELTYDQMDDITDKTLEEVVNELDNFFEIYKYEHNTLGLNDKAGIKADNIYLTPGIDNIHVGANITTNLSGDAVFSGGTTLNKYLDIKDLHCLDRVNDKITLRYDTDDFELGPAPNYNLQIKSVSGDKVVIKDNAPLGLYSSPANPFDFTKELCLRYDDDVFKTGDGPSYDLQLKYNTNEFQALVGTIQNPSVGLELKNDGIKANKLKILNNRPIYATTTATPELDIRFNTNEFQVAPAGDVVMPYGLELKDSGIKGSKIDFVENRPIYNNTVANNQVDFRFNTDQFEVALAGALTPYALQLKDDGVKASKIDFTEAHFFADGQNKLSFKMTGLGGLSANADGVFIKLAEESGLRTSLNNENGVKIKLPQTSGLELIADGLRLDLQPDNSGLTMDATGVKVNLDQNKPIFVNDEGKIDLRFRGSEFKVSGANDLPTYGLELNKVQADKIDLSELSPSLNSDGNNKLKVRLANNSGLEIRNVAGTAENQKGLSIELLKNTAVPPANISGLQMNANGLSINLAANSGLEIDSTGLKTGLSVVEAPSATGKTGLALSADKQTLTYTRPTNALSFINVGLADDVAPIASSLIVYIPATNTVNFTDRNILAPNELVQVAGLIAPVYQILQKLWEAIFGVGIVSVGGDLALAFVGAVDNINEAIDRQGQSGNIDVNKIPKDKPLSTVDGRLTLKYNNNHLVLNKEFSALQLHRAFADLIDWSEGNNANNSIDAKVKIVIFANSISDLYGKNLFTFGRDALGNGSISIFTNDNHFVNKIVDGYTSVVRAIDFPQVRNGADFYEKVFFFGDPNNAYRKFTDPKNFSMSFWCQFNYTQFNRVNLYGYQGREESVFVTKDDVDDGGNNNGIEFKFKFDQGKVIFLSYCKHQVSGGGIYTSSYNNDSSYYIPQDYEWHHFVYILNETGLTLYVDGVKKINNHPHAYPIIQFINRNDYIFGGYNHYDGATPISFFTRQYYQGKLSNVIMFNKALTSAEVDTVASSYSGDQKVFADRLKLDTGDFDVGANKELKLKQNLTQSFINTSNYVSSTSNFLQTQINGKANTSHTHSWSDITDKPLTFSPSTHSHQQSDITGLSQSFIDTSNYVRSTSNFLQTQINGKENTITILPVSKGGTGIQTIAGNSLLGSTNANTIQAITVGTGLSLASGTLSATASSVDSRWTTINTNDLYLTNQSGKVGIGLNTAPLDTLHLHNNTNPSAVGIRFTDGGTGVAVASGSSILKDTTQKLRIINYQNQPIGFFTNNTERLIILGNGNVGIGTTDPSSKLHISETTGTQAGPNAGTIILDHENTNGYSSIIFRSRSNRGSDYGYIQYQDNTGSGENAKLTIGTQNDTDDDICLMPSGDVGIGVTNPAYKLDVTGDINTTGTFRVNGVAFTGSSQWTTSETNIYYNSGNVGIGTTTPFSTATKLTITGSSSGYSQPLVRIVQTRVWDGNHALEVSGFTSCGGLRLNGADTGNTIYQSLTNADIGISQNPFNSTGGNIHLNTFGSGASIRFNTSSSERMRITSGGNVGIGVTNPGTKLEVNGDIKLTAGSSQALYWADGVSALGRAVGGGNYSTSAVAGDIILRSANRLLLQSGSGGPAITINTNNTVNFSGAVSGEGTVTANQYICKKSSVTYGTQLGSSGAFILTNGWWANSDRNANSHLLVSITAKAFDGTVIGWWQGRVSVGASGGCDQFFVDRSNRINVSNFWDASGGNYIRILDTQMVSNFSTVEYKVYG